MMKLSDKLIGLRKSAGMSQEELAEKLNVSRQAVSRWEMGTAMPDAVNILQLSKLFHVTTDYLLNEEYESDADLPQVRAVKADGVHQGMILLVTLEVMSLILQFTAAILLQSTFFTVLSFLPFVAAVGGFEYAYQKKTDAQNEKTRQFRRHFYEISVWLGLYFPLRLLVQAVMNCYPRPYVTLVLEGVLAAVYLLTAALITLRIEKQRLPEN